MVTRVADRKKLLHRRAIEAQKNSQSKTVSDISEIEQPIKMKAKGSPIGNR